MSHPFHEKLEAAGHRLIRTKDGDVDMFRLSVGYHNGPECEFCGSSWCQHCETVASTCPAAKPGQPEPVIQIHTKVEATSVTVATKSLETWVSQTIAEQVQKHPPGTRFMSTLNSTMVITPDSGVSLAASLDFHTF